MVTTTIVFRPRLHEVLRHINEAGLSTSRLFSRSRDVRTRDVSGVYGTTNFVRRGGVNTLVIFRHRARLNRVVGANAVVSTISSISIIGGVFFPGSPLRSNTIVIHSNEVCTTNYVLPLDGTSLLGSSVNAHRHTTVNVDRGDSTIILIISRRANAVSVTRNNGVAQGCGSIATTTRLHHLLVGARGARGGASITGMLGDVGPFGGGG